MDRLKFFIVNVVVCFVLPQLLLAGCSLIGYGLGALSDSSSRDGGEISVVELRGMREGQDILVFLEDARRIEGEFISTKEENARTYREQYMAAVAYLRVEGRVPLLGDSVTFGSNNTPWLKERGKFRGVDPGAIVVNQSGRRVFMSDLNLLKADSTADVDLYSFSALVRERKLPFLTRSFLMKVGRDTTEVPIVNLVRVEVNETRNARYVGLVLGAAIDAVAIILLTQSAEESCRESTQGCGSQSGGCKPSNS